MIKNHKEFLARKFNLVLIKERQKLDTGDFDLSLLQHGIALNFKPTVMQKKLLKELHEPINLKNTLFTFNQAKSLDIKEKIDAQVSEYILSYRFGGAFIRDKKKTITDIRMLEGITKVELRAFLESTLDSPIALRSDDIPPLSELIVDTLGRAPLKQIRNNELKVKLLTKQLDNGHRPQDITGEDIVRYIVLAYTETTLLIKSQAVLNIIRESEKEKIDPQVLFDYAEMLAVCFNRFKPILLAIRKTRKSKKAINKISHLSKRLHKPVGMPRSRTFIADFLNGNYENQPPLNLTVFDWLRILNSIKVQLTPLENDVFQIRNGKIWYKRRKTKFPDSRLVDAEEYVISRIKEKLSHLKNENIKLPQHIKLGLPISEKQSIGALPFGSVVSTRSFSREISAGVYWENQWGARDLDLSTIDISGERTGWGDIAIYTREDVLYSGDITNAPDGAMEFMTVARPSSFGLFVNIYSGKIGSECKLVIGSRSKKNKQWIDNIYISEKTRLNSRGNLIGFLNSDNEYIVYQGRLGGSHVSSPKNKSVVERAMVSLWTLDSLFEHIGFSFDSKRNVTIDLSYDKLTFRTLAEMLHREYTE